MPSTSNVPDSSSAKHIQTTTDYGNLYGNLYLTTGYFGLFPASAECLLFELDTCPRTSKRSSKCFSPALNGLSFQVETNFTPNRPSPKSLLCNLPDSRRHVTRPNQGLSSLAQGGGKRRDPGNDEKTGKFNSFPHPRLYRNSLLVRKSHPKPGNQSGSGWSFSFALQPIRKKSRFWTFGKRLVK